MGGLLGWKNGTNPAAYQPSQGWFYRALTAKEVPAYQHPALVGLSTLPPEPRQSVINAGHLAKGLGFGGVLFIDGQPISPRTWQALADELLNP